MDNAKINPPKNRKISRCPNDEVVSDKDNPPVKGNRIIGNKEVTAIGTASVIHQIAIHIVEAKTAFTLSDNPSISIKYRIKKNNVGPKIIPIFFISIYLI